MELHRVRRGRVRRITTARGELRVRTEHREFTFQEGGFVPTGRRMSGYGVHVDSRGSVWTADFKRAVRRDARRYRVGSKAYGGRDPRHFYEDPLGRVWVVDFADGFYEYRPEQDDFRHLEIVQAEGADIRVDVARDRTWLLHYHDGPTLVTKDSTLALDLSTQETMYALHLGGDGRLYVAGWHGITVVTVVDDRFSTEFWAL